MKPYKTKKLEEFPDMGDIREEGRRSGVGNLPGKSGKCRSSIKNPANKKAIRRQLKRGDKAKLDKLDDI